MELLSNYDKNNHMKKLREVSEDADEIILVSPFLSNNIKKQLDEINEHKQIKYITLITVLKAYNEGLNKADSLTDFVSYCEQNNIKYSIFIDEELHSKVYLFYKNKKELGGIITSANFTIKGLENNHEMGIYFKDTGMQSEVYNKVINCNGNLEINKSKIEQIKNAAEEYKKLHPEVKKDKQDSFDPTCVLNLNPSKYALDVRYFIKPIGSSDEPYIEHKPIDGNISFSKKRPSAVRKNDILICYAVSNKQPILGYYRMVNDQPFYKENYPGDRWPWHIECECLSNGFSNSWWKSNLFLHDLVEKYHVIKPGAPLVVHNSGTTLGGLQHGLDKIQLQQDFATFLINQINNAIK